MVEELVRQGIRCFCLAPGSRSTPLAVAVAAHPQARHLIHYDERGTAFFALGYARATGLPAVWITTSGTALANGYPAIVEAAVDSIPMLLITADRPPELRQTGANQTIDQVKLFGDSVRWFFDLPTPTLDIDPAMVLTTIDQAVYRSHESPGGPVHINCMFREPLAPTPDGKDYASYLAGLEPWLARSTPFSAYINHAASFSEHAIQQCQSAIQGSRRGLIVAGRLNTPEEGQAVLNLAEQLGWPVLPDIGSQIRLGHGAHSTLIAYYDLILNFSPFVASHKPETVLHLGKRPVSKRLLTFLSESSPDRYIVVNNDPTRYDPHHQVTHRYVGSVVDFCDALGAQPLRHSCQGDWLEDWKLASVSVEQSIAKSIGEEECLSEPQVARIVSLKIPNNHGLVLASSMPIRDMDTFSVVDGPPVRTAANRGASGIDGLVATAAGFSDGHDMPVTLLIGDLALLHDLNSLSLLRDRPVTIVVINNDGGGIFSFLPIAEHSDDFEPLFGTPHGLDFEAAAKMFGIVYRRPNTLQEFLQVYADGVASKRSSVIEVATEREANHALHEKLFQIAREAVEATV